MNPIVYAIPVFLLLIGVELLVAARRRVPVYRLGDAVASIGLGALSQVTGIFSKLIFVGVYVWFYQHGRIASLPSDQWWVWLTALLLYDLLYYWHHRMGHEVAVLWAAHAVHHQSDAFNLSTALRQTSSGFLLGWLFYVPMALLGFPPLVFVVVGLIDLLYQFWIHTELIGKLGWFDRVFASPSNHRVHHGVNDRYLDKNYGGILILWDRLFGTYEDEHPDEPVLYGTRAPLRSLDPLWANLQVYADLARESWQAQRWSDKLRVWLKPPGWRAADVAQRFPKPLFDISAHQLYEPQVAREVQVYSLVQFALLIAAGGHCLALADQQVANSMLLAYVLWISVALWSVCGLLQGRTGFVTIEALRWLTAGAFVALNHSWFGSVLAPPLVAFALIFIGAGLLSSIALRSFLRPIAP